MTDKQMNIQALNNQTAQILKKEGFEKISQSSICLVMPKIIPRNLSAMIDSLIEGNSFMLKLFQTLQKKKTTYMWNFVHVIITDGVDEASKNSVEKALTMMNKIGNQIPVQALKMIFVGVEVDQKGQKQLKNLAQAGGQNAEYYNNAQLDIQKIFDRIQINIGLQKRICATKIQGQIIDLIVLKEIDVPILHFKVKKFAFMFSIDVSNKISNKWKSICQTFDKFMSKIGEEDLISGLFFNNQIKFLNDLKQNDALLAEPTPIRKNQDPIIIQTNNPENNCRCNDSNCEIM